MFVLFLILKSIQFFFFFNIFFKSMSFFAKYRFFFLYLFFVLINYLLLLFFFSLSLFVSFLLRSFQPTCSRCKFILHSNSYLYEHKLQPTSRTKSFLSKMVFYFLFLSFNSPLSAHQSMRYFFGGAFPVGNGVWSFLNLFVHLIANAQIQNFTRDKNVGEIPLKLPPTPKKSQLSTKRNRFHCF